MATKEIELEVDFIGEQVQLTVEEEKAISAYFNKKRFSTKHIPSLKEPSPSKRKKETVFKKKAPGITC